MKAVLGAVALVWVSAASAAPSFVCGSRVTMYQVRVTADWKEARVTRAGLPLQFGKLECTTVAIPDARDVFLLCRSQDVVDAGYQVNFIRENRDEPARASIEELWLGGVRHLETVSCTR